MTEHDSITELAESKELIQKLSPNFNDLSLDLNELRKVSSDPLVVSALLFKLVGERRKSNELLEQINEKFDKIMFELKTKDIEKASILNQGNFSTLGDADQQIMGLIESKGQGTAREVMHVMNYKGLNAASQRLNKLFKEGMLRKVQAGKKVLYLPK